MAKRKTTKKSPAAAGRRASEAAAAKPARGFPRPDDLYRALLELGSLEDCRRFLDDLCTPSELMGMKERWRVAQLVDRGVPYREIHELTGVSTATVTRVGRALTYGAGGYRNAIDAAGKKGGRSKGTKR